MHPVSTVSQTSLRLLGKAIAGAEDRQQKIPGFDQAVFSKASVLCIGAGGIVSQIAPTLVRKGIGRIALLDDDVVEASNLNRQRFYARDLGMNKAFALAANLQCECTAETEICGLPFRLQEAVARGAGCFRKPFTVVARNRVVESASRSRMSYREWYEQLTCPHKNSTVRFSKLPLSVSSPKRGKSTRG